MAKNWEYAQLSQQAAAAGGPETWINAIKANAYADGVSDTKRLMALPFMAAGAALYALGTVAAQKIGKFITERQQKQHCMEQEATRAEKLLKRELYMSKMDATEEDFYGGAE